MTIFQELLIYTKTTYLQRLGIKAFLTPIFIVIILSLFGFKFQETNNNHNLFLFDVCLKSILENPDSPDIFDNFSIDGNQLEVSDNLINRDEIEENESFSFFSQPSDSTEAILADSTELVTLPDSTLLDTVKIDSMSIDSTARLKYFRYQRNDRPYVEFDTKKRSSFFAKAKSIQRIVKLDSTGQFVLIQELVAGEPAKTYFRVPIDEYIRLKIESNQRDSWEALGYKYEKKEDNQDLSKLITDITNIDIPLPSSAFFSIFGPNRINLRINGSVDIHGAWRNESTEGVTASRLGNTKNEPDFKQQVQINVSGTVGDKLTISADWNTERTFEYENQLKLKYTGYEDEIIQSIEAGNVSLQTSPLIGGSEALFGVKANFQLGPFKLTALASQKKGETEEVSVSGGSTKNQFEIRTYDYSENHFFIDEVYANNDIFKEYYGSATPTGRTDLYVEQMEVWKTTTGNINQGEERKGNAFIDLPPRQGLEYDASFKDIGRDAIDGESVIDGRFVKLVEGVDYIFDSDDAHRYTGYITFKTQINPTDAIGIAYRVKGTASPEFYGEFINDIKDDSTVIVLKLIKPANLQPQFKKAWKLQLKNIYPMGGRDIKEEGFQLDINYAIPGQEPTNDINGVKLLEAFQLDVTDQSGSSSNPDGAFDFKRGLTIIPLTGEIIFPDLEPFGIDNFQRIGLSTDLAFQLVYDTTKTFARQEKDKDRFIINGEYSASVSSVYSIGFNVVENSVKVFLGGRELNAGIDYSVDYNIGQVTIRDDDALVPGADLRITYEKNDLFSLASKTLLGFRGLFDFSENTKLGFSFLNLNQQTLSDKVRIGEEPLNNSIMGADFKTTLELPFLTKGLDNLISTNTMSSFSLSGEYAYINPDPNTKKSPIAADNNQSLAYIDDFEGAKKTIPIGVNFGSWKDLSVPDSIPGNPEQDKQILMNNKAKSFWYNITPSDVRVQDLFGERRKAAKDAQTISTLDFVYRPDTKGTYNRNLDFATITDLTKNWGGTMRLLSSTANNLIEENVEFIEFWIKVVNAEPDAKIYIDLGQISEDVIPNNTLDTEDKNGNDRIDEGEDLGIDGWSDVREQAELGVTGSDPMGDNFSLNQGSTSKEGFVNANGTQGNAQFTDIGLGPDSEDLNRNFSLDRVNSYFRYEIPLDTVGNPFLISGGAGDDPGWNLFRIPLKDFVATKGNPSFSVIETIRLWTTGQSNEMHLRIAEFNLVGNQWQKIQKFLPDQPTVEDTVLILSTINVENDPRYTIPPGVERERDRTKPDEEVFENEQSLQLILNELPDGERRDVVKFLFRPLDLFNYSEMKMFIHGDLNDSPGQVSYYVDENDYGSEVYFRFGADTLNFYEYRQPVRAGWNEVKINFDELTPIKQNATIDSLEANRVPVPGKAGHSYSVLGDPTLTRVTFFMIGVENPNDKDSTKRNVSGEVWINELRVLGADDSKGWAYRATTSLKFADLLTVGFNINQTDPNFHKLNERFGSRIDRTAWGLNVDFNMLKLIPLNLPGSNLQIKYQRNESVSKPVYLPGKDVLASQAAEQEKQRQVNLGTSEEEAIKLADKIIQDTYTVNTSESWSASNIRIKVPSRAWYINDIINNLSFGFNYNKKIGRSPTIKKQESWIWNANANYNLNLGKIYFFKPIDIPFIGDVFEFFSDYKNVKIYFIPQTYNTSFSAKRNRTFSLTRTLSTTDESTGPIKPRIQRDFTTTRSAGFSWQMTEGGFLNLSVSYNTTTNSSLAHILTLTSGEDLIDRSESDIWSDVLGSAGLGKPFDFTQTLDFRTNPSLPSIWDINKYIRINAGYNVSYNWKNNFQQEELGRGAGFSSRVNAGINLRLKSLFKPLFEDGPKVKSSNNRSSGRSGRGRGRGRSNPVGEGRPLDQPDSTISESDSLNATDKESTLDATLNLLTNLSRIIFFDYDQISFNFNQTNTYSGGGLKATGTGISNFWAFSQNDDNGPSRLFMLGLKQDLGQRAPGGTFSDNFSQKNTFDFKTSKPLWDNATIDLSWNVGWGLNKSISMETDSLGFLSINNVNATGTLDRSFLSLPPVFVFSMFDGGIKKVSELYNPDDENPAVNLSNAFVEGFETFPLLAKIPILSDVSKYIPRPNWTINWSGLENIGLLKGIVNRASLTHGYSSSYSEGWKINPDGIEEIQTQRIAYGFNPLIGLNLSFEEIFDGNLSTSVKFSSRTNYSLGASTRNITETFTKDISISASYSKSGFEIPLFGVSLKNDLEISFSYTNAQNSTVIFEMDDFKEDGKPQDGTIRTTLEPRIKYIMSSRVTLSLFYKRTQVEPEGVSRIPPTTTNEAGLDVHISIN